MWFDEVGAATGMRNLASISLLFEVAILVIHYCNVVGFFGKQKTAYEV